MKKIIASVLIAGMLFTLAACGENETNVIDNGMPFDIETVAPPTVKASAETLGDTQTVPAADPRAVILTAPYEDGYELYGTLDYEAFLEYLAEYYGKLYGESMVISITDMIDHGEDEGERGVVTVLAEYHTLVSLESGRNGGTVCGGCNFFFTYDKVSGRDFGEQTFAGDVLLHNTFHALGNDFADYTATVDSRGFVQLVKAGQSPIKTPAEYRWDMMNLTNDHQLYVNQDNIVLLILAHEGENASIIERPVYVYTSHDGGETWDTAVLDYTPTTTTVKHPVCSLVLNMRDDMHGSAILGTNRCEVFFYVTEDGGKTWEKRRNFKLKNYQTDALYDGGLVTDELGFITFAPRDKDNPNVYITHDGGLTWALMDITLPDANDDGWVEFCKFRGYDVNAFHGEWEAYALGARLEDGPSGNDTVVSIPVYVNGERFFDYTSLDFGKSWHWGIGFGFVREDDGTLTARGLEISYLQVESH